MTQIISTNPGKNYREIGKATVSTDKEIKDKAAAANNARDSWQQAGLSKRIGYMKQAYDVLFSAQEDIAQLITREIGTPISECRAEVAWNKGYFNWFVENVTAALEPRTVFENAGAKQQITYEPLGTVAAITPWNLPFDMFIWAVIPNLLAGNTVVYKAAEECILTGKLLEKLMQQVKLPTGVLSFVHGGPAQGQQLVKQPVDLIWFTGSSEVGKKLYQLAGKKFIKAVMELGGSNPGIVIADADLDLVTGKAVGNRFAFCGQTCDALKRLIVHQSIYKKLLAKLTIAVSQLQTGDPENEHTQIGPLASRKQLQTLVTQVNDAKAKGARILTGGKIPQNLAGAYYLPTLITDVKPDMKIWREEVFGPVLPVASFSATEEAVKMANDTSYGLGAMIFSKNLAQAQKLAAQIKSGNVTVNGASHFLPYLPFGGFKNSGMGREHGIDGFRELCQLKTISLAK